MAAIEQTLHTLRDIEGVYGSFVIAANGALVARDLPEIFDAELLAEVGPRVTRLYETFMSDGEDLDACVIRYAEHKLYLRAMTWGTIGVLSGIGVNMPALRMVANLVIRKIDPELPPHLRASTPPAAFEPAARSLAPPDVAMEAAPYTLPPPSHDRTSAPATGRGSSPPPPDRTSPSLPPERTSSPPPENPAGQANGQDLPNRQVRMYRGRPVVDD